MASATAGHEGQWTVRTDLADAPTSVGTPIGALVHVSDLHVVDVASPMRFEWIETLAHDPRWHPLLHMHRPQEGLVPWVVEAQLAAIRSDPRGPLTGRAIDLVLSTGDNIDNAQRNELDAYLALLAGGRVHLPLRGGPQDPAGDPERPWPYWCPDPLVADTWRAQGYPAVPGLLERTDDAFDAPGIGLPWTSLPGNHDLLCQGTSFVDAGLAAAATGGAKGLRPPPGFQPADPLAHFVDDAAAFLAPPHRPVVPLASRAPIDAATWVGAHAAAGALGWHDGAAPTGRLDTFVDLGPLRLVLLDTNHPAADYQGSIGTAQLDWLDARLAEVDDDPGRVAIVASHHGAASLVNRRGDDPARVLTDAFLAVAHRHPALVAWLTGHRHVHRVVAHPGPGGGFWELTTASQIDWPAERRTIEIVAHPGGVVELVSTVQGHAADPGSLAALHLDLARRFAAGQVRGAMEGRPADRDVRLVVGTSRR